MARPLTPALRLRRTLVRLVAVTLLGLAVPAVCAGQEGREVPPPSQVPIFLKLLTYDRALTGASDDPLRIGILIRTGDADSRRSGEAFTAALDAMASKTINRRPFTFVTLAWSTPEELEAAVRNSGCDVLYLTAGQRAQVGQLQVLTRELGVLSLGAESGYVDGGLSIGLGLKGGRPQIWVNLEALHQEGHPLDARILRLCKVVTPQ